MDCGLPLGGNTNHQPHSLGRKWVAGGQGYEREFSLHIILHLLMVNHVTVFSPRKINTGNCGKRKLSVPLTKLQIDFERFSKTEMTGLLLLMLSEHHLPFYFCRLRGVLSTAPRHHRAPKGAPRDLLSIFQAQRAQEVSPGAPGGPLPGWLLLQQHASQPRVIFFLV